MVRAGTLTTALICVPLLTAGCDNGSGPERAEPVAERTTLSNGVQIVSYTALPDSVAHVLSPDLVIGTIDGDASLTFGDIRSIEAGDDGTIFVLDTQASQIRTFSASGTFERTIASEGEGPGELTGANGMILIGDSLLWIQDRGKRSMLGMTRDGTETHRIPLHVVNFEYAWNGTVDNSNRFWKPARLYDEAVRNPPEGLSGVTGQEYLVSFDMHTEAVDSIALGPLSSRQFVARSGTRTIHFPIPFDPDPITVVNPAGGFWQTAGAEYRVARLSPAGDTTLVISADVLPQPVTGADRREYVSQMIEFDETILATAEEVADLMPEIRPQITGLVIDERENVWVERGGAGAAVRYDVFTSEGAFLTSVGIDFTISDYLPPRIRGGNFYALTVDELDVQYVARAPLPAVLTR